MMKAKIVFIDICLVGLISACGLFSSHKFNPHKIDGLYRFIYHQDLPAPDSLCSRPGCFVQKWWTNYMFVDYPYFHICAARGQGLPFKPKSMLKEHVKFVHIKGNYYEIRKINGTDINNKNTTYTITKDSHYYTSDTTNYLYIRKLKNKKKYFGYQFTN